MTVTMLPGNFAKIQCDGHTVARVHALVGGTWHGQCGGERFTFTGEFEALLWFRSMLVARIGAEVLS